MLILTLLGALFGYAIAAARLDRERAVRRYALRRRH